MKSLVKEIEHVSFGKMNSISEACLNYQSSYYLWNQLRNQLSGNAWAKVGHVKKSVFYRGDTAIFQLWIDPEKKLMVQVLHPIKGQLDEEFT